MSVNYPANSLSQVTPSKFSDLSPGGDTWSSNVQESAAGKPAKLPCPEVRFLKMIPSPGVKFQKNILSLSFFRQDCALHWKF